MTSTIASNSSISAGIKVNRYRQMLITAGISVPTEIEQAVEASKWKHGDAFNLTHAIDRAAEAQTEDEYQAIVADALTGMTKDILIRDGFIGRFEEAHRVRRFDIAVRETADQVFDELISRFNAEVPVFEEAASQIPDLREVSPADVPIEAAIALDAAKKSAAVLGSLWDVYVTLGGITGRLDTGDGEWYDHYDRAFALSPIENMDKAHEIALSMYRYAQNAQGYILGGLAPFISFVTYEAPMNLCLPEEIRNRWEAAQ